MLILAIDTTTRAGSAAVMRDGRVLLERSGNPSVTHGERLPSELMQLLEAAGESLRDVELFAVAAGPGSFTGLRIGIATVQGLAMAAGRLVVPVSALDALAYAGRGGDRAIAAWMDAQRGEVFATLYDASAHPTTPATCAAPGATLDAWQESLPPGRVFFIGDGAERYAEIVRERLGAGVDIARPTPPLAGAIAAIAWERRDRAVLPHAIVPLYIRRPDAELARARRQQSAGRLP